MTSTPGPLMEFLGRVAYELYLMKPLLPTYLHLLISAIFPIYTAAHASLARPSSAAPAKIKKTDREDDGTNDDDEPSKNIETLTPSDAILFPILAGCTLAGLYFILKLLKDPATLNYWLGIYFAGVGFFFATSFFKDTLVIVRSIVLPTQYSYNSKVWKVSIQERNFVSDRSDVVVNNSPFPGLFGKIPVPSGVKNGVWAVREAVYAKARLELNVYKVLHVKLPVDILDVVGAALSIGVVGYHTFIDKPWFLTNLLGFSFCYGSLQFMTPGTSWTGTLLLSALFFYDIYFVFYTPMMVTVATKLDVPIKLLFPRPDGCVMPVGAVEGSAAMEEYLKCIAKKRTMAMLGLGDIVIPGMMLAFALRFDLYLFYQRMQQKLDTNQNTDLEVSDKPKYKSATGSWGERFWTSSSLRTRDLRMKQFPKTYFNATVTGYVIGMITTVLVMQVAQHAQPALLYLVPGVLMSFWGTAFFKGDLKTLWNFSEVPEDPKKTDQKSSDENPESNTNKSNKVVDPNTDTSVENHEVESSIEESTSSAAAKDSKTPLKDESNTDNTALPNVKPGQLLSLTIDLIQQPSSSIKTNIDGKEKISVPQTLTQQKDGTSSEFQSRSTSSDPQRRETNGDGEPPRKRGRKV